MAITLLNPYWFGLPVTANLVFEFDASDAATITSSSGNVSQWDDKSGNDRHLSQGTAANQPRTGVNTMNGLNTLYFDDEPFMTRSSVTMTTKTLFVVAESLGAPTKQGMLWRHNVGSEQVILRHDGTTEDRVRYLTETGDTAPTGISGLTSPHLLTARHDGSTIVLRRNGTQIGAASPSGPQAEITGALYVGGLPAGINDEKFNGDISHMAGYSTSLSDADMGATEDFLMDKWGIS